MGKRRVVSVTWLDAASHDPWDSVSTDVGISTCTTLGYLLHSTPTHVTVSHTIGRQGTGPDAQEDACCAISIPRGCIVELYDCTLRKVPKKRSKRGGAK